MNTFTPPNTGEADAPRSAKHTLGLLAFAVLVWMPLMTLLRAWVLVLLWGWFVVPQFGTAPLSWPIAAGFSVIFSFLTGANTATPKPAEETKENIKRVAWAETIRRTILPSFGTPLLHMGITLIFGLIIHLFVGHG